MPGELDVYKRQAEGYGEDPYTNGVFAAASVRGYQGDDMSAENRMACLLYTSPNHKLPVLHQQIHVGCWDC